MSKRNSGEQKKKPPKHPYFLFFNFENLYCHFSRIVYHDYFKGKLIYFSRIWSSIFNFFLCADEQRNAATVSEVKRRKRRA